MKQFKDDVREIEFKGEKYTKRDIEEFQQACRRKKAVAENVVDKRGFWDKLT